MNSSISASPSPCAMPPWIWPSTSVGLMARPTSCAATIASTFDGAEHDIDLHLRHLRGEAVGARRGRPGRSRRAAWSAGPRCRCPPARRPSRIGRQSVAEVDPVASASPSDRSSRHRVRRARSSAHPSPALASARILRAQGHRRRAARHCRTRRSGARRRSCRRRRSDPCRRPPCAKVSGGRPSASAAICSSTVEEPWPISTAPLKKVSRPSRAERDAHGRGVGQRGVAAAVPHAGDADAAPASRTARRCAPATRASAASQSRLQRVEAFAAGRPRLRAPGPTAWRRPARAR